MRRKSLCRGESPLAEVTRLKKLQSLPRFFGKGLWVGDLAAMRDDRPRRKATRGQANDPGGHLRVD